MTDAPERVMVIETAKLEPYFRERGADLITDDARAILDLVSNDHFFVDRPLAEREPRWRQIIPYVIVTYADDVYTLRRTTRQTEARLHEKLSIGIGGHINPGHDLQAGLKKELDEEVEIEAPYTLDFAGVLNDESTEVGRVHLGAVFVLHASTRAVRVRETEKMTGSWVARRALAASYEQMETWSQIAYDALLR